MENPFTLKSIPNAITIFRGFASAIVIALLLTPWTGRYAVSFWLFVVACLSDFFDGYLARRFKAQSKLGAFLDPLFDKLLVLPLLLIFIPVKIVPAVVLVALFLRDIAVSVLRSYLARKGVSMPAETLAKWKTVAQMLMLGLIIGHLCWPEAWAFKEVALASGWVALFLSLTSAWGYFQRFFMVARTKR